MVTAPAPCCSCATSLVPLTDQVYQLQPPAGQEAVPPCDPPVTRVAHTTLGVVTPELPPQGCKHPLTQQPLMHTCTTNSHAYAPGVSPGFTSPAPTKSTMLLHDGSRTAFLCESCVCPGPVTAVALAAGHADCNPSPVSKLAHELNLLEEQIQVLLVPAHTMHGSGGQFLLPIPQAETWANKSHPSSMQEASCTVGLGALRATCRC